MYDCVARTVTGDGICADAMNNAGLTKRFVAVQSGGAHIVIKMSANSSCVGNLVAEVVVDLTGGFQQHCLPLCVSLYRTVMYCLSDFVIQLPFAVWGYSLVLSL